MAFSCLQGAASVDDADEADGGGAASSWQDGYPPVPQGNKGKMGLGARSSGPKRGRDEVATATVAAAAGGGASRTEVDTSCCTRVITHRFDVMIVATAVDPRVQGSARTSGS